MQTVQHTAVSGALAGLPPNRLVPLTHRLPPLKNLLNPLFDYPENLIRSDLLRSTLPAPWDAFHTGQT
jgi:hypothetical protein